MTKAIMIAGAHKYYPNVHAVNNIDLSIEQGEFFGLLGPNGAGKSTLINMIAGLTRPDQGRIAVMGHDVVTDYRAARRCLGVVPQELVFDAFFTVREALRIQSGYFGLGRQNDDWIDELLTELMLMEKADANMRTLSGGMKRRVLIAQALVHRPDVVVLDEPTAGVDIEIRKLLWGFIERLHSEGQTIVLTTHYLEEAETLCDKIAIMNHGSVVALDTKQGLLNSELGKTVNVRIITEKPVDPVPHTLEKKLVKHEGNVLELMLDKGTDSIVDILNSLQNRGIKITDLHTERADLEDIFLEVTYKKVQ